MFVRLIFSQHFKESFELASSSVHEDGAVFGACGRVEQAVDVLLMRYPHVKVVPIITTCSTEVIGDDIDGLVTTLNEGLLKEKFADREVHLIPIHSPSFVGSMVTGYDLAVKAFVTHFAEKTEPNGKLNLFTGWVNPGVVGQIIPWNFPLLMAAWKISPALAAGNCVVIKPSIETSLSLLELAKLMAEVLPAGVVNVITGKGSQVGNAMLGHDGFAKLAFTGSTEVGYTVADFAAKRLVPSTLEFGGKSANIIFPDAPWGKALEGVQLGILLNQGQVCCAGSRAFIHEDIYDQFLEEAVKAFSEIKVDLPWLPDTQMGTQINQHQLDQILKYIEIGKQEGARVAVGGSRAAGESLDKGSFMQPTILADVTNDMRVAREEIFGPVVCFIKFKTEDEVIAMANDNEYGLGGAVWTKDMNRALNVARSVETGRMWVNTYNVLPAHAPFGGYKKSGIGRENHRMMLDHYTQCKNIFISLSEQKLGLY